MFGLSAAVRVYLAKEPADMRKSFDGLSALVAGALELDPLSGHLFVFINKRRDRIKILYWDRDGLASGPSGSSAAPTASRMPLPVASR
jgi:transposase